MSFADPQTVTIAPAGAVSLPRTSVEGDETVYTSADGLTKLSVSHQYGKRVRRVIRIDTSKIAPDSFRPQENTKVSMSCYLVFDLPPTGYTPAEGKAVSDGFIAALSASSGALITKLLAGES